MAIEIVNFPIEHRDFPLLYVSLPEGNYTAETMCCPLEIPSLVLYDLVHHALVSAPLSSTVSVPWAVDQPRHHWSLRTWTSQRDLKAQDIFTPKVLKQHFKFLKYVN